MRATAGGRHRARMLVSGLALLFLAGIPRAATAGPGDPIPDLELTAEEFDETIAFTPDDDTEAAIPPFEVHEVDAAKATAAGATKVVDGATTWLEADEYQRNDILNEVEANMPAGTDLVIDVSTGDIWQVPLADGAEWPDAFQPWTFEEYAWLDSSYDPPLISWGPLTRKQFARLTDVASNGEAIDPVRYLKSFGPIGYREIQDLQAFQVALAITWLRETPVQRYLRLVMLRNYYARLPQFQGAENRLVFALMVPDSTLFAISYYQYRYMLARSGIQSWTLYDMAMLPVVLTVLDRQIRGDRLVVGPVRELP